MRTVALFILIAAIEVRPSVDASGERIAMGREVFDRDLRPVSQAFRLPNAGDGISAISPSGEYLYMPSSKDGILRYRTSDGAIVDRMLGPGLGTPRLTPDGHWFVIAAGGGLSVYDVR